MDNFNLRNMQLAYTAVYDQNLCESMEELGLIGEGSSGQDQFELWVNELLDEGYDLSDYTWDELYENYQQLDEVSIALKRRAADASVGKVKAAQEKFNTDRTSNTAEYLSNQHRRAVNQHKRLVKAAYPSPQAKKANELKSQKKNLEKAFQKENYDAFDVVLEYLLDEGFAETVEGAEAIMVNMSEGWIETILEGMPAHLQSKSLADINAAERKEAKKRKEEASNESGYGKNFNKPEHSNIPNSDWLEKAAAEKKKFGRPIGKHDPAQIRHGDIEKKFPENRPGANSKPRVIKLDRKDREPKKPVDKSIKRLPR